ncbi:unnamed protein product [Malus baccata var. baccata]
MCLILFYSSLLLIFAVVFSIADDATSTFQSIREGETVVSTGGTFELGFWSPDASNTRYVGIWYKHISVTTIVWVANRDKPLPDLSGILKVTNPGILVLNHNMSTVWSSNTSRTAQNPVARLLDSGNLVVIDRSDDDSQNFLWQSFDYPGDTFLPGMKIGRNTVTGFNWHLRSWKSPQDPSQGNRTSQLGPKGYAELFVREGSVIKFRSGPWNGVRFSGNPQLNPNPIYTYGLVSEPDEMYYSYKLRNSSIFSRLVLTSDGHVQRYTWIDRTKDHEDDTKINAKYSESNAKKMRIIISTTVSSTGLLILGLALLFYVWKKKHQKGGKLVAWMLHTEGRPLELLDTSVKDSITLLEVVRTIHVGLLCVQRNPEDRPSMSAAVLMLSGEGALPQPLKPGFYSERDLTELEASHSSKACSANEVTISVLEAR